MKKFMWISAISLALYFLLKSEREVMVVATYSGPAEVAEPVLPKNVIGANVFKGGKSRGVGFLLDAGGRQYIVSALHVFVSQMTFRKEAEANEDVPHELRLGDQMLAKSLRAYVPAHAGWGSDTDCSGDFIAFSLPSTAADAQFLKLSRAPLEIGQPVWVYTVNGGANVGLYKARLGLASNKVLRLEQSAASGMISGGPVVNALGEVIGVVSQVGSWPGGNAQWAVPLGALRKHFKL
jgi:hypothetical protein